MWAKCPVTLSICGSRTVWKMVRVCIDLTCGPEEHGLIRRCIHCCSEAQPGWHVLTSSLWQVWTWILIMSACNRNMEDLKNLISSFRHSDPYKTASLYDSWADQYEQVSRQSDEDFVKHYTLRLSVCHYFMLLGTTWYVALLNLISTHNIPPWIYRLFIYK